MSTDSTATTRYHDADEVEAIVRSFESCDLPDAQFNHPMHLTVAFWYLSHLPDAEAHERMRASLYRYIKHHGGDPQIYNETVTLFWLKRVRSLMNRLPTPHTVVDAVNEVVERGGGSRLVFDYYSKEFLMSDEARSTWVEPDLKPLDF